MKNLILIVSVFLTLQSCNKKELSLTEPGGEEVKLTLSAAQQPGAVGDTVTGEAASITQMTFIVFSAETGAEVQRITQSSSDPEFGDFSITLKKAEYDIVAIASRADFGINQYYRQNNTPILLPYAEANMQYWQDGPDLMDKRFKTVDTFCSTGRIRIVENQHVTMSMRRIIGKLEVVVMDVKDFWVRIKNEATGYMFKTAKPFGKVDEKYLTVQSVNGVASVYILQTGSPLQIVVGYGQLPSQQRNFAVRIDKNMRTIVRGNMLNQSASGFKVTIDDKWVEESNIVEL